MSTITEPFQILLVEDSDAAALLVKACLKNETYQLTHVKTGSEALEFIKQNQLDVILLDLHLPDTTGFEILEYLRSQQIKVAVIVLTAYASAQNVSEAMRLEARDFLEKPFQPERLLITLRNTLEHQRLERIKALYECNLDRQEYFDFIGGSLPMQTIYRIIDNVATSKAPVFITGESGTGKELCAQAIYKQSKRSENPFIAINCAAIPHDLFESELFGHVKGAFTGAIADREGAAARAHTGTLFLDEIGDMNPDAQTKLLRFIQTSVLKKVGGNKEEQVDVRFICATNHNIQAAITSGRFREDLFYRLSVVPIQLPPLRRRNGDILLIARHFLTRFAREEGKEFRGFAPATEQVLKTYHWPGNVRQLQNVIHNVVVLHNGEFVTPAMLPDPLTPLTDVASHAFPAQVMHQEYEPRQAVANVIHTNRAEAETKDILPLWKMEKTAILHAIQRCNGDVAKAAVLLEVNASTIYRKLRAWKQGGGESAHGENNLGQIALP